MSLSAEQLADPSVTGPLGSLAWSVARPANAALALSSVRWHRDLLRLGIHMPLALVNDFGLLLAAPNEQLELGPRAALDSVTSSAEQRSLLTEYRQIVEEVASSEAARRSRLLKMSDDLVVVLLARLFARVAERCSAPPYGTSVPLDVSVVDDLESRLVELYRTVSRASDWAALRALAEARLYVLTLVDALDVDTLQLFGMLGGDTNRGALAQVDLLAALGAPEANDVANFSLEILPSVLEAKARPAASTHAAFGYAGLARKGSIDSLVLTELVWDTEELMRRVADDEVLYYAREQARDDTRRIHYILVDATASMRGDRATFARGMAIATAKKLVLTGEDVVFRFFDSRLYEPHASRAGKLPLAHLLSFKGERGRNPDRVFSELDSLLALAEQRDSREPFVYVFTHGALYIPRDTVATLARRAKLAVVFMLPSGGALDLDYLDLLDAHWVVDHQTLASKMARADNARRILDDVGAKGAGRPGTLPASET